MTAVLEAPAAQPITPARRPTRVTRTVQLRSGVQIAVSDSGPAHQNTTVVHNVVYLHGVCLDRTTWSPHAAHLVRRYSGAVRAITLDLRGHGQSSAAPIASYTIDQCALDLAEVLGALDITGAVTLVGHSMGAMIALAYHRLSAGARPHNLHGLVLVASAAGHVAHRGLGRLLNTPATTVLAEAAAHTPERALRLLAIPLGAALAHWHPHNVARQTLTRVAAHALTTTSIATAVGFLPTLRDFDVFAALGTIDAHTTVISGGLDLLTPPEHSRELAAAIPGCRHINIPSVGHMIPQEAPHVITDAIVRTIRSATGAKPTAAQHHSAS